MATGTIPCKDDSGWITLATSPFAVYYRKVNGIVEVSGGNATISSAQDINFGTLPVGYRPKQHIWYQMADTKWSASINENGVVGLHVEAYSWVTFHFMFIGN